MIEQVNFTYYILGKALEKQNKNKRTIRNQGRKQAEASKLLKADNQKNQFKIKFRKIN